MKYSAASTNMLGQEIYVRFSLTDCAFLFASFFFDRSLLKILTPLIYSGCVYRPSGGSRWMNQPE
jgi:hypothetical protein